MYWHKSNNLQCWKETAYWTNKKHCTKYPKVYKKPWHSNIRDAEPFTMGQTFIISQIHVYSLLLSATKEWIRNEDMIHWHGGQNYRSLWVSIGLQDLVWAFLVYLLLFKFFYFFTCAILWILSKQAKHVKFKNTSKNCFTL